MTASCVTAATRVPPTWQVDPGVVCDTHSAIKCKCDGSRKTMEAKV